MVPGFGRTRWSCSLLVCLLTIGLLSGCSSISGGSAAASAEGSGSAIDRSSTNDSDSENSSSSGNSSGSGKNSGSGGGGTLQPRIVRIDTVNGVVRLLKASGSDEMQAIPGMNLARADTLITDSQSNSILNVDTDKSVDVCENVRMTILEILGSADMADKKSLITLETGKIYVRIRQKLAPGESFEVQTPTCILGVRGTEFLASVEGNATELYVLNGIVDVLVNTRILNPDGTITSLEIPFVVEKDQWVRIDENIRKKQDIRIGNLNREALPAFVLVSMKKNPAGITSALLTEIDAAIAQREALEERPSPVAEGIRITNPWNGHQYMRMDRPGLTFGRAFEACRALGGHLATVTDEREQHFLERLIAGVPKLDYWIGLMQAPASLEPDSGWNWVTGEFFRYANWHAGVTPPEPNNSNSVESAGMMYHGDREGKWRDADPMRTDCGWICEWDRDPSMMDASLRQEDETAGAAAPVTDSSGISENPDTDIAPAYPEQTPAATATPGTELIGAATATPAAGLIGAATATPEAGLIGAATATPEAVTPSPTPQAGVLPPAVIDAGMLDQKIINPFLILPLAPDTSSITLTNYRKIVTNNTLSEVEAYMGTSTTVSETLPAGVAEIRRWGSSSTHIDVFLSVSGFVTGRRSAGIPMPSPIKTDLSAAALKTQVVVGISRKMAYSYLGTDIYEVSGVLDRRSGTTTWRCKWLDVNAKSYTLTLVKDVVTNVLYGNPFLITK